MGAKPVTPAPNHYYVFVNVKRPPKHHEFYIVRSAQVVKYAGGPKAENWRSFEHKDARSGFDRWDRLK
jgi:hypothetical protein